MSQQEHLPRTMDLCLAIHQQAAEIYATLAKHEERSEVSAFWHELSAEMDDFIAYWKSIQRLVGKGEMPATIAGIEARIDPGETIRQLEYIDSKTRALLNCCRDKGSESLDSFLIAYDLATYLIHPTLDDIFRRVVELPQKNMGRDEIIQHLNKLASGAKEYGDSYVVYDLIKESLERMWSLNKQIAVQTELDYSTGAFSRKGLMKAVLPMVNLAQRNKYNIAIMMVGMDDIGDLFSKLGHKDGDEMVKSFSRVLDNIVRTSDLVGRYDFSTFFIYLSQVNQRFLYDIAQRIVDNTLDSQKPNVSMFVNIGASYGPLRGRAEETLDMLIKKALDCLIRARMSKGNRVLIE